MGRRVSHEDDLVIADALHPQLRSERALMALEWCVLTGKLHRCGARAVILRSCRDHADWRRHLVVGRVCMRALHCSMCDNTVYRRSLARVASV